MNAEINNLKIRLQELRPSWDFENWWATIKNETENEEKAIEQADDILTDLAIQDLAETE